MGLAKKLKRRWRKLRGLPVSHYVPRQDKILKLIDVSQQQGLEIGALCNPLVTKSASHGGVHYVDWATAEQLRAKFRDDPNVNVEAIVETDYLWGKQTLAALVAGKQFDYVIASHMIEHVPNLIGWLRDVAAVLRDGGVLSLAIPDKRYTFDLKREPTTLAALVEAYLLDRRRPSIRDVFDYTALVTHVDVAKAWSGSLDVDRLEHSHSMELAWSAALRCRDSDDYIDIHVTVLTPRVLLELLASINRLGLLDFSVENFVDTARNELEFFVTLRRTPRELDAERASTQQHDSIVRALASLTSSRH